MYWLFTILILPYCYFLLRIYRSLKKIIPFKVSGEPSTFVSLVIACRNEEKNLPLLLHSLSEQDYPLELVELIIIDDNSSDETSNIVAGFKGKITPVIISNNGMGKKAAIRTGIKRARGNLIITTDADCLMGKYWIRTIVAFYERHKPDMIICPVQLKQSAGFFGRFQELEFLSLQGITAGTALSGNGTMCNGANLAFTRMAYTRNEGNLHFEIQTGDDVFFLHSLKKQEGSKILWLESKDALVTTKSSLTLASYFEQRKRWISKSYAYRDRFSIVLGIITFVAIMLQVYTFAAVFIRHDYLPVFLLVFFVKSVPDFLILYNTTARYERTALMRWWFPSQFIYPFYVFVVAFYTFIFPRSSRINSPSPTGT